MNEKNTERLEELKKEFMGILGLQDDQVESCVDYNDNYGIKTTKKVTFNPAVVEVYKSEFDEYAGRVQLRIGEGTGSESNLVVYKSGFLSLYALLDALFTEFFRLWEETTKVMNGTKFTVIIFGFHDPIKREYF